MGRCWYFGTARQKYNSDRQAYKEMSQNYFLMKKTRTEFWENRGIQEGK